MSEDDKAFDLPHATRVNEYVKEYLEKGYVIVRNVLDQDLMKQASKHVEWLQQQHPDVDPELLEHWYMRDDPFWISLVSDKRLLNIVEQFVGPNIASFASHYVCKPPKLGKKIHWHQDGSYWPLKPMEVISVWLAVDESNKENGCMRVVPGSHKQGLKSKGMNAEQFKQHVQNAHKGKSTFFEVDENTEIVDVELHPGDISIHHPAMVHGSNSNESPRRRCGLTIRYIPTSTQVTLDADNDADKYTKGSVYLVRGKATDSVSNPYRTTPKYDPQRHFNFQKWD